MPVRWIVHILCISRGCMLGAREMTFDETAVTALACREGLVQARFTNYIERCASQSTNVEMALTANLLRGFSRIASFDLMADESHLAATWCAITNVAQMPVMTPDRWQYWHLQILKAFYFNTMGDEQSAYLVASNAWDDIQVRGVVDSTNAVSRALLGFEELGEGATLREAMALSRALTAAAIGRTNDVNEVKPILSDRLRQKMEDFLRD